jgi:hypothetical protein
LPDHRCRDLATLLSDEHQRCLNLLILCIGSFEMLVPIAHRPAAGLGKPEHRISGSSYQVVTNMGKTATNLVRVDRDNQLDGDLERCELCPTSGQETMVAVRLTGRGCLLSHTLPKGGRWLSVKGRRVGERPQASAASHAGWGSALD